MPNTCWYKGSQHECGLSLSCVFSGAKAMDLCNGGMVWSCCVPNHLITEDVINVRDDTSIYEDFPPTDPSEGSFITTSHDVTRPPRPDRPGRPEYTRPPRLTTDFHHHDPSDEVAIIVHFLLLTFSKN